MHGHDEAAILIVDDEAHVRDVLSRWLREAGYDCEVAATAEEALALLVGRQFALVLTDVNMPGRSGIELLTTVRRAFPETAVIMVTAVDDRATAVRTLRLGAYGYVTKPFDQTGILINVVNAVERRRLTLEHEAYARRLEEAVRERTAEVRGREREIVVRLGSAARSRHEETGAHLRRIGACAARLAQELGWSALATEDLAVAAQLHDIGKIGVPDEVLLKPGRLTGDEFAIVQTHTLVGAQILGGSDVPLLEMAADIALHHHENWDGTGYPDGLANHHIPEAARIVALVDVHDALVHDRGYRPAMPADEAFVLMVWMAPYRFDPNIFDCFIGLIPQFEAIRREIDDTDGRLLPPRPHCALRLPEPVCVGF